MGFCYNRQGQLSLSYPQHNPIEDRVINKRKKEPTNYFIPPVRVKQIRHKLSARDRAFLRSIGLKLRDNSHDGDSSY